MQIRLPIKPPYDWHNLLAFYAARAIPGVERVEANAYSRTIRTAIGVACMRAEFATHASTSEITLSSNAPIDTDFVQTARRMFDVALDASRVSQVLAQDIQLAPLVNQWPGLRMPGAWSAFECAVRAVLGQQVSVAAARTLAARLVARAGGPLRPADSGLTHLFPTPAALAAADLNGLGITGARILALRALANAVLDGELNFNASTRDFAAQLTALPGFGAWSAQYIAMRALADPDAFPAGDLVLRKMMASAGGSALSERALLARAEAWRPWRAYAALYLWRSARASRVRSRSAE